MMNWDKITLKQFQLINEANKTENETERVVAIASIVWGDSVTELPLSEFNKKVKELSFLSEEIPSNRLVKKITINDRKYFLDCLLGNITTSQYIDYINHLKGGKIEEILSVFVIPNGHKYNDGYDMAEVISDIEDMPITVVNSTAFFFARQYEEFIRIFQSYSMKKLKKTKMNRHTKKQLMELLTSLG